MRSVTCIMLGLLSQLIDLGLDIFASFWAFTTPYIYINFIEPHCPLSEMSKSNILGRQGELWFQDICSYSVIIFKWSMDSLLSGVETASTYSRSDD